MKVLVVDTNALIDLFDGDQEVAAVMSSAEKVWIPAVVLGEVRLGMTDTKRGRAARQALADLLNESYVDVLGVTAETADFFVTVMRYLKEHGTPIPTNDVWIAAGVLETGSVLLSRDRHFSNIPMIRRAC